MNKKKNELTNAKVYQKVRNMIALHRFKPGFKLNVQKLSKELGVSRTPVWEAMRRLEQEGVVETIPNRGVFITRVSFKKILEVVEVRGALDAFAGRLACERIDNRTIDRLSQCLPEQLSAIENRDIGAYLLSDNKFHGLIYKASGNSYLMDLFEMVTLRMLSVPVSADILIRPLHEPSVFLAHRDIIDGLADRDQAKVELAITQHTEAIITFLKEKKRNETEIKETVRKFKEIIDKPHSRLKGSEIRFPERKATGGIKD